VQISNDHRMQPWWTFKAIGCFQHWWNFLQRYQPDVAGRETTGFGGITRK